MGLKVGFWGAKMGRKWVETHFSPTLKTVFKPISGFSRKPPFLASLRGVEIVFYKGPWGSPDPA